MRTPLVGLHGRADGRLQPPDLDVIRIARIEAVKLMSTAAPEDVEALRAINPHLLIVVRLFADFRGRVVSAADFAAWSAGDLRPFYARGVRYFEIHNEPNLAEEGMWTSWSSGFGFAAWFGEVYRRLKALYPDAQFGFPGVSPGGQVTAVRAEWRRFLDEAADALKLADWVGAHCYWQSLGEMVAPDGGKAYLEVTRRAPAKPLMITEFGNAAPAFVYDDAEKAAQYLRYWRDLPSTVTAAFAFVVSASSGFDSTVWRNERGQISPLAALVGGRPPVPQPDPAPAPGPAGRGFYEVTAAGLNIRAFPWEKTEPPIVGYLSRGDTREVIGLQRTSNGSTWGWLAPIEGGGWINLAYAKQAAAPVVTPAPTPPDEAPPPRPAAAGVPAGKGLLVWQPWNMAGGDPERAADAAAAAGLAWVSFKVADRAQAYPFSNAPVRDLRPFVAALRRRGIGVGGWHYVYGAQPEAEADAALRQIEALGLDHYLIDAEGEYKARGMAAAADRFLRRLRPQTGVSLGLCSYRFPRLHPELPWATFLGGCDFHAPQVYPMGQTAPTAFGVQLAESVKQLQALRPLPVVPIGPVYRDKYTGTDGVVRWWEPSVAQLDDFNARALSLGLPAVGWYDWDWAEQRPAWWQAIAAQRWPQPQPA